MALSIEEDPLPHQLFFPTDDISILVIDNDIDQLKSIEKICSHFNYKVKTCTKASEALNLLMEKRVHFDVVLIEAKMPDMDSYVFLQHVTQQMNIPVIMMCVDNTTSVAMNAIENGACDLWLKPLSGHEIKNIWKYVAKKLFDETKKEEMNEIFGVKRKKELEKDNSKLPLINGSIREGENDDNVTKESSWKKTRVKWSSKLHQKFVSVVNELGVDAVVPSKILEKMNVAGLTRENIASHLQKYRLNLKSEAEKEKQKHQIQFKNAMMQSLLFPNISHAAVQQNSMPYHCSSYQQFPNNLMATNFPHQPSNLIWQQQFPPAEYNNIAAIANINNSTLPLQQENNHVYQTNNTINNNYQNSLASVNQHNFSGFGGINSITDSSFGNTLNAHYPQNTLQGGSFFLGCNSNQIPMTQQPTLPMLPPLPIDASGSSSGFTPFCGGDIGDTDANMAMTQQPLPMLPPLPIDTSGSSSGFTPFCGGDIGDTDANMAMTQQPLPMLPPLPIDASGSSSGFTPFCGGDIGDTDANMTMAQQPLPMLPPLPIDASGSSSGFMPFCGGDIGDTDVNMTMAQQPLPMLPPLPIDASGSSSGFTPFCGGDIGDTDANMTMIQQPLPMLPPLPIDASGSSSGFTPFCGGDIGDTDANMTMIQQPLPMLPPLPIDASGSSSGFTPFCGGDIGDTDANMTMIQQPLPMLPPLPIDASGSSSGFTPFCGGDIGDTDANMTMIQQPLPMLPPLPIDASGSSSGFTPFCGGDIGDTDANMTMAEEAELDAMYKSTQNYPFYY